MSGSVAEALLASGSKKLPLLSAPPKRKKEPKTYCFDLELTESTDQSYPEYSWTELIRGEKEKDLSNKAASGNTVLDPFASDDEDDLKAMAAKFEAKYNNNTCPTKKKKRRVEDYIDRGAGYDESDPFIDNSDIYDEVVPPDLETVRGGFYINSGSLDFKQVELSEDEEDNSLSQANKTQTQQPIKKAKVKITPTLQERNQLQQKDKNPVGRPPGIKKLSVKDKETLLKKRRMIITPVDPRGKKPGSKLQRVKSNSNKDNRETTKLLSSTNSLLGKPDSGKVKLNNEKKSSSSESGSSSSDSGSGSSSSDSESSSSEETEDKTKPKLTKSTVSSAHPCKSGAPTLEVTPIAKPKPVSSIARQLDPTMPQLTKNITQPQMQHKRVKTKNVPLNPKLHPNLSTSSSSGISTMPSPSQPPALTASNPPPPPLLLPQKALSKDLNLIKSNGASSSLLMNLNARAQSQSQAGSSAPSPTTNSPSVSRAPTPKPIVSMPSASPSSLTISAVTPSPPNSKLPSNNNAPLKTKAKMKQSPGSSMPTFPNTDIINSITNYAALTNFANLNFGSQMPNNQLLSLKGINMLHSQKSMPNLKKIPSQQQQQQGQGTSEKLVQQQKPKVPKVVKNKQASKPPGSINVGNTSSSPSGLSNSFMGSGNVATTSSYLSSSTYKTPPPPLAGPGVEISKVRSGTGNMNNSLNSTPKSSPNALSSSSPLVHHGNVSSVYSSGSPATSNTGITSIFSSPSSIVNSVSSSLTVQRLPHSITITPSGHYSGGTTTTTKATSSNATDSARTPIKTFTSFDVQALLQGSNFLSGNSKSGAGKPANSIVNNNRDMQRK